MSSEWLWVNLPWTVILSLHWELCAVCQLIDNLRTLMSDRSACLRVLAHWPSVPAAACYSLERSTALKSGP